MKSVIINMSDRKFLFIAFVFVVIASVSFGQQGTGLQTSIAVDAVVEIKADDESSADDRLVIRGTEIAFYGPIDHLFDGMLSLAAHPENGESLFEIHEAFIGSTRLIPRSRFRLGQFFLGLGRLNQIHQHDWPFISAPYIHQFVFNDSEGAIDTGLEYSILMPGPVFLDVTLGATDGFTYGHSHDAGKKPQHPNYYVHVKSFFNLLDFAFQPGISYLQRIDHEKRTISLLGLNLTGKKREGKVLRWLFESEFWHQTVRPQSEGEQENTFGFYLYPQYGFNGHWFLGIRGDYFTNLSLESLSGAKIKNYRRAIVPTLTYKASEFSTFRLAYTDEKAVHLKSEKGSNKLLQFQAAFILGAHPAHDF